MAEAPPSREIAAVVMPGAERLIEYHLIARGACWGQVVGQEPIRLNEGSARAGTENILARLSELMFVEALRRYLEALPSTETGWLAGVRDPVVGQALAALHAGPAEEWTVERLARAVGSRGRFWPSASPRWSASRRCKTSRCGVCSSCRGCSPTAVT